MNRDFHLLFTSQLLLMHKFINSCLHPRQIKYQCVIVTCILMCSLSISADVAKDDELVGIYSLMSDTNVIDVMKVTKHGANYFIQVNGVMNDTGSSREADWTSVVPGAANLTRSPINKNGQPDASGTMPDSVVIELSAEQHSLIKMPTNQIYHLADMFEFASATGYVWVSQMGPTDVIRRPLPNERKESKPSVSEVDVAVHTLNYASKLISSIGVAAADDSRNGNPADSVLPYSAGSAQCCFFLPKKWKPGFKVAIVYRLDGDTDVKRKLIDVPKYPDSQTPDLWVLMRRDESIELLLSSHDRLHAEWPGEIRAFPEPPPAYKLKIWEQNLQQEKAKLALYKKFAEAPDAAQRYPRGLNDVIKMSEKMVRILEKCEPSVKTNPYTCSTNMSSMGEE